ncbi:Trap dicarboxylate family transporter, dctp subunit [Vibrio nigripulchritudo MADA3029]|uniref:Trap dicarboxylate family transporter, dctp subunit n=1 Tax=Vibrio nigripulchritudo SOn1 TaxID=1238450 RepID=A0AAV2VLK0_9VIBR|nr:MULTISPECIES: TRAP transporter substrate-binding protein [Vibrio]UAB73325.1 TRAP transporter substrate-binding protein [Vibrio sp. SCSIO 43132]CCN38461.1 Trap dicarboxylate family transporter, dctp subunit [Vibrio nigripulchritudo AM115]CCN44249.1 Trap dicarboxylate family transporter, dctp subunit [Vibrio nigripulchritudo FTn2]CCN47358.1 Trap dicarboxylate family transporter, dctp subunit [Vibrio nigripulchritudo MADA3020]CCN55223.1 Trap dicarboxylate family transporter, dctp subunit [Vibr
MKKLFIALLAAVSLTITGHVSAEKKYSFVFQSSDPAGNPTFEIEKAWAESVNKATNGQISIEMLPVDSVVKYNETHDAIAAGILDGHITATGYISGKDPAFALIGNTVGAWSSPYEMLRYINYGGGKELLNELLNSYGVHMIGATSGGLEAFVSTKPLSGVADLKGLKLRAPEGLVQEVFAAAGAAPVNLPGSEVFTSLDKKVIDAADYTVFSANHSSGMHDIATHPVYPGFHSLPLIEVSITKKTWDKLPEHLKVALELSVDHLALDMTSQLFMKDLAAVADAKAKGVTIHDWSQEERAKFRAIAKDQWKKVAKRSPAAQKVYDSILAYLTSQGLL